MPLNGKKKTDANCDVCNETHTIRHLLFDCSYSVEIWDYVTQKLKKKFYYEDIVLGINIDWVYNTIVSLIVYIIYSEWCKLSFEKKERRLM